MLYLPASWFHHVYRYSLIIINYTILAMVVRKDILLLIIGSTLQIRVLIINLIKVLTGKIDLIKL